jgi:hypothetical protein
MPAKSGVGKQSLFSYITSYSYNPYLQYIPAFTFCFCTPNTPTKKPVILLMGVKMSKIGALYGKWGHYSL